jgi:hypothetical protein
MNLSATQSIAPRLGGNRSNGTRTDYAYETDGDLDWMREQFAGGATASMPNDTWVGIDYAYDKSGRQTLMSATDSVIMGAMPAAGLNGPANKINQVASVAGRPSSNTLRVVGCSPRLECTALTHAPTPDARKPLWNGRTTT